MNIIIQSEPPMAFYSGTDAPAVDNRWRRLVDVSEIRSSLRINGGETPNASVTVDNGDGELTNRFSGDVLRAAVTINRGGTVLFRGIVRRIKTGAVITLDLEA